MDSHLLTSAMALSYADSPTRLPEDPVMEMNAAIVKEWTGFPLDGAPVEDSESGHSDARDG